MLYSCVNMCRYAQLEKQKSPHVRACVDMCMYLGASGRTRTVTSKTLEPKSSASTNFATPAGDGIVPEITAEEKFESISID